MKYRIIFNDSWTEGPKLEPIDMEFDESEENLAIVRFLKELLKAKCPIQLGKFLPDHPTIKGVISGHMEDHTESGGTIGYYTSLYPIMSKTGVRREIKNLQIK